MSKYKIAVLFGGVSSEHEVSCVSATSIIQNLPKEKYEIIPIGITKNGHWLLYSGPIEKIANGSWETDSHCKNAIISPDSTHHGLLVLSPSGKTEQLSIDCIFPIIHGKNGEDGTLQGLLTLSGIPYVGCDTLSSAVCMDKDITHKLLTSAGITNAKWRSLTQADIPFIEEKCAEIAKEISFPIFIKPANAGSSVGISKANDLSTLKSGILAAFTYDQKVICEEMIVGRELECAVLGNEHPRASAIGEIIPCNDFYDYEAKYQSTSTLLVPAKLDERIQHRIQQTAIKAYLTLGCSGLTRVDFFLTEDETLYLNEPNTLPGFTTISMYPRLWEESGLSYPELLHNLIEFAMEKQSDQRQGRKY